MEKITIPKSVTTLESNAFEGCSGLKSFYIPKNVTKISSSVFNDCPNLSEITVDPENEKYCSIDGILFTKNKSILCRFPEGKTYTSYTVPNFVLTVEEYAFQGCDKLKNIYLPNNLGIIGDHAFWGCKKLESLIIPDKVTYLGNYAFDNCQNLKSVTIPRNVQKFGRALFENRDNLTDIYFSGSEAELKTFENQIYKFKKPDPKIHYYYNRTKTEMP